ncbi:MAG: hypothetical protein HYX41_00455 [Bdellovibrio sp.]|nr:hypothetical protein [Bdellovibrio sp.]
MQIMRLAGCVVGFLALTFPAWTFATTETEIRKKCAELKFDFYGASEAERVSIEDQLTCLKHRLLNPESGTGNPILACRGKGSLLDASLGKSEGMGPVNLAGRALQAAEMRDSGIPCNPASVHQSAGKDGIPSLTSLMEVNSVFFGTHPTPEPGDLLVTNQFPKKLKGVKALAYEGPEKNIYQHSMIVTEVSEMGEPKVQHVLLTGLRIDPIVVTQMKGLRPAHQEVIQNLIRNAALIQQVKPTVTFDKKKVVKAILRKKGKEERFEDITRAVILAELREYQDFLRKGQPIQKGGSGNPILDARIPESGEQICSSFAGSSFLVAALRTKLDWEKKLRGDSSFKQKIRQRFIDEFYGRNTQTHELSHQGNPEPDPQGILDRMAVWLRQTPEFAALMEFPVQGSSGSPMYSIPFQNILPYQLQKELVATSSSACDLPIVQGK